MIKLTSKQTNTISLMLEDKGITYSPLKEELLDELATEVEVLMSKGMTFRSALNSLKTSIETSHLKQVQKKVIHSAFYNKRISRYELKIASLLALSLALWVLIEYLIGKLTGVGELGPLYGSLSIVLIIAFLVKGFKHKRMYYQGGISSFPSIVWSGFKIMLVAILAFGIFLTLFWIYIYPTFYLEFQGELKPDITFSELVFRSVRGICMACLIIGMVTTLIIARFSRNYKTIP